MSKAKKPRRKKKRHYKTGIHVSIKCIDPIHYRSSWEQIVAIHLDSDPMVKAYAYEAVAIPYVSNIKTNRIRNYYPDFFVQYQNNKKLIIEVKRNDKLKSRTVIKKANAAKVWANQNGYEYEFWTNEKINLLKKL